MIVRLVVTRRSAAFEYVRQLIATEHGSNDDQRYKACPDKGQGIARPRHVRAENASDEGE